MKKTIYNLILILLTFSMAGNLQAESVLNSKGKIDSVQLYRDRAVVVRNVEYNGKSPVIVMEGLPSGLYDETITIRFLPDQKNLTDEIRVKEIRVEKSFTESFTSDEAKQANERLIQAKDRLAELTRNYNELTEERKSIESISPKNPDDDSGNTISLAYFKKLFGFTDSALKENLDQTGKLLLQIDDARTDLALALAVAERYSFGRKEESKTVTIELDSTTVNWTGSVQAEYAISGAYWYPVYRYALSGKSAKLTFLALVSNETGEDWDNVNLSFSAADAGRRTRIPDLKEWKIARVYPGRMADSDSVYDEVAEAASGVSDGEANETVAMMKRDRRSAVASKPSASGSLKKNKGIDEKEERNRTQQRLDQSIHESRDFYNQNLARIKDDEAQRKSRQSQKKLDSLRKELSSQEERFDKKDYRNARKSANNVIDILNDLNSDQRRLFEPEIERARKVLDWSYQYEKTKEMQRSLSRPDSSAGTDTKYTARFRESIPSDGAFVSAYIEETKTDASLSYEINAVQSKNAYLAATSGYTGFKPLLPGPVQVYFKDDYAGQSRMPLIRRGQKFTIRTGIDPDIEVQTYENRFEKSEGVFVESVAYTIEKTIQVKNNRAGKIEVILYDRIPVAVNSEIKVTDVKYSEKPDADKRGVQTYKFTLNPGQVREFRTSFTLKHDKDLRPVFKELNTAGY